MNLDRAIEEIRNNALMHNHKRPNLEMLMEEVQELSDALMGIHEHDASFELVQIGGIVTNWLAQIHDENELHQ